MATPANWKQGDDVTLLPSLSEEDAKKLYPDFKVCWFSSYVRVLSELVRFAGDQRVVQAAHHD